MHTCLPRFLTIENLGTQNFSFLKLQLKIYYKRWIFISEDFLPDSIGYNNEIKIRSSLTTINLQLNIDKKTINEIHRLS